MIETKRLILRPFNKNDAADVFEYLLHLENQHRTTGKYYGVCRKQTALVGQ